MTEEKTMTYPGTKTDLIIRPLREAETGLLDAFLYLAIFVPEGVEPPPRSITEQPELKLYTEAFGTKPADCCLLAESDGEAVGAAWARIMDDYGHIDDATPSLAVSLKPAFRGRGIGTALMKKLMNELKQQGYSAVSLSVQKQNRAHHLYRRLGFQTVRETEEEWIMKAEL